MDLREEKEPFDHTKASISDKINLISELEHIRRHALRSAASVYNGDDEEERGEEVPYLIFARQAQELRRAYMRKHFGDIKPELWCLCKSSACLRQLAYEVCEADAEELKEIEALVDDIWELATGEDLSDCSSCKEDKEK